MRRGFTHSSPATARLQSIWIPCFGHLQPSPLLGEVTDRRRCNSRSFKAQASSTSSHQTMTTPAADTSQQQQQQQQKETELPSLLELLSTHGARLTTAAQMVWSQVLQPGDTAVDATCGNGNDTLFMAQRVGPTGTVYGIDIQESAVESTRHNLQSNLAAEDRCKLHLVQGCHSEMQQVVGSNVAKLVAFNLGYLPGGDKQIITQAGSTLQAVEAALEVVCPGGLVSIMCYIGHSGGLEEYEQVRELLAGLPPNYWTSSELRLVNRATAPIMLMVWRRPDAQAQQRSTQ